MCNDDRYQPPPCLTMREVVHVLWDGYEAYDVRRRAACYRALVACGPRAGTVLREIVGETRMNRKRRKLLMALADELDQSPPPPADRDSIVLTAIIRDRYTDLSEDALEVLRCWPRHGVADWLILKAFECRDDAQQCCLRLRIALINDAPSDASREMLEKLTESPDADVRQTAADLMELIGMSRKEVAEAKTLRGYRISDS